MSEYQQKVLQAHEAILHDDLLQMRNMINKYAMEKGELPQSLDDLVHAGYLHEIPKDPTTDQRDWKVSIGENRKFANGLKGVVDVHSVSTANALDGSLYSTW